MLMKGLNAEKKKNAAAFLLGNYFFKGVCILTCIDFQVFFKSLVLSTKYVLFS